jgi:hypothetical protein
MSFTSKLSKSRRDRFLREERSLIPFVVTLVSEIRNFSKSGMDKMFNSNIINLEASGEIQFLEANKSYYKLSIIHIIDVINNNR